MDSRRLERIILIILALLNVFLLAVVLSDSAEARRNAKETAASVTAMLEENGMTVAGGVVRLESAPSRVSLSRDIAAESEKVRKLIGEYTPEDVGGNIIYYRGEKGQALLRGSGELDVVPYGSVIPLRGSRERTAEKLLRGIGVAAVYAGEGENTDFYCCFDAVPVYNAILSFTFSDACLTMLTGTRLFDNAQRASGGSGMDSVSALLRFVEIVRTEGYICSRIDSMEAGYYMTVSRSGASELTPVWRIGTDTGVLLIDAESGKVIK